MKVLGRGGAACLSPVCLAAAAGSPAALPAADL
jgi:hypothetical protein